MLEGSIHEPVVFTHYPSCHAQIGRREARNVSIVKSSRAALSCGVAWNVASTIVFGRDRRSELDVTESIDTPTIDPCYRQGTSKENDSSIYGTLALLL